jgi:hypothetical protein
MGKPMFNKLARGYRKIRYLPRHIVFVLDRIAVDIDKISQDRDVESNRNALVLQNIHSDVNNFCDDTVSAMLALRSNLDTVCSQITLMDRKVQAAVNGLRQDAEAHTGQADIMMRSIVTMPDSQARDAETHTAKTEMMLRNIVTALDSQAQDAATTRAEIASVLRDLLAGQAALAQDAAVEQAEAETGLRELRDRIAEFASKTNVSPPDYGGEFRTVADRLDEQASKIEHLSLVIAEQARIFPSWMWTPESAAQVRAVLALITPVMASGVDKVRVGRESDGGYIMLNDFAGIAGALSLGIADDVSWDIDVANRGIPVLQFDHSVTAPPEGHELFRFEPLRVSQSDEDGAISLDTIVRTRLDADDAPLLLKIDIEGDEWEVFQALSETTLSRFKQIVCEFHDLDRLAEVAFSNTVKDVFEKLSRSHFVHHVHGNNCGNFANVANVIVPQSIEVSFASRSAYHTSEGTATFPTQLDRPNQPGRADLYLGQFRFD